MSRANLTNLTNPRTDEPDELNEPMNLRTYEPTNLRTNELNQPYGSTYASASISMSICGSISRGTSTMAVAGRMSGKNSPCARPTSCQLAAISTTYSLVRTTSFIDAPALASADSMFFSVCTVC